MTLSWRSSRTVGKPPLLAAVGTAAGAAPIAIGRAIVAPRASHARLSRKCMIVLLVGVLLSSQSAIRPAVAPIGQWLGLGQPATVARRLPAEHSGPALDIAALPRPNSRLLPTVHFKFMRDAKCAIFIRARNR